MVLSNLNILVLHGDTPAGQASIQAARARGFNIYAAMRSQKKNIPEDVKCYELNTSNAEAVENLATQFDNSNVPINILVTCPSFVSSVMQEYCTESFEDMSVDYWDTIIENNLKAAMLFCKTFGRRMRERGKGRIVQLISNVAIDPHNPAYFSEVLSKNGKKLFPSAAYASSMAGLLALTRHLAAQYRHSGVLINNIIYGPLFKSEPPALTEHYVKRIPMGRAMTVKDLADTLDLLLDPNSNYITGQSIVADGGVAIW